MHVRTYVHKLAHTLARAHTQARRHTYLSIHTHTNTFTDLEVHLVPCMFARMLTSTHMHTAQTCTHMHALTCKCTHTCTHTQTHTHARVHVQVHTDTHQDIHTHKHNHLQAWRRTFFQTSFSRLDRKSSPRWEHRFSSVLPAQHQTHVHPGKEEPALERTLLPASKRRMDKHAQAAACSAQQLYRHTSTQQFKTGTHSQDLAISKEALLKYAEVIRHV